MTEQQSIDRILEERRRTNEKILQERKKVIHTEIPEIQDIDNKITHISISWGKLCLQSGQNSRVMNIDGFTIENNAQYHEVIDTLRVDKLNLLKVHGYNVDYLDPIYTCPHCKDTGYLGAKHCSCYLQLKSDLLFHQSPIRKQLELENFDTFRDDLYSDRIDSHFHISPRQNINNHKKICEEYVKNFEKEKGNLLLYGHTGVGKTFLTNCIAREIMRQAYSVVYVSAGQLFDTFSRQAFRKGANIQAQDQAVDYIMNCDLLIIDDLGTEMNNSFVNSHLFSCVNGRILNHKGTIISSNLDLNGMTKNYTERITSRFLEHYRVLPIFGDDIRLKKGL